MKKNRKLYFRYFTIVMLIVFLTGIAAGCHRSAKKEEPVTISVMIRDFGRERTKYIDQLLEKKENIHIKWTIVPIADYDKVFEQKAAAGELPDLFETKKSMVDKYTDTGSFLDFSEYLDKMPNLKKWMDKIPAIYNDSVDGENHMYCLTTFNTRGQAPQQSIYRKDIFDRENLGAPQTIDELYQDLVYLKKKYPDSIPVGNRWKISNLIRHLAALYHSTPGFFLDNDSLTYEYGPATENFKKAMVTLRKFYKAGLIDPDFATISDEEFVKEITDGKILFLFSEYLCCLNTEEQGDWNGNGKKQNPDFDMEPLEPLDTEVGNGLILIQVPTSGGNIAIAVNSQSKHIDEIIKLLNDQYSDEMIELVNWGIEGETYEEKNGQKTWLINRKKRQKLGLDARSGVWIPIDQDCSDSTLDVKDQKATQEANAKIEDFAFYEPKKRIVFSGEKQEKADAIQTELNEYCEKQYMEFITGKKNMGKDWDNFVKNLEQLGYKEVLQMYREAYEKLPDEQKGLDKNLGL